MITESVVPDWRRLRDAARMVRTRAWAPYSGFAVGASVLTSCGKIFTGCNVENASYGLTVCAERAAVCAAVAAGFPNLSAVCVSLSGSPSPCGACRQFLMEFNPGMYVLLDRIQEPAVSKENSGEMTGNSVPDDTIAPEAVILADLLPRAFRFHR